MEIQSNRVSVLNHWRVRFEWPARTKRGQNFLPVRPHEVRLDVTYCSWEEIEGKTSFKRGELVNLSALRSGGVRGGSGKK